VLEGPYLSRLTSTFPFNPVPTPRNRSRMLAWAAAGGWHRPTDTRQFPRKGSVMIPMVFRRRHQHFQGRLGILLAIGLSTLLLAPERSPAAAVSSNIKLDADDLSHPLMLDQNGNPVALPTRGHPVVLASGVMPSYVAYTLDGDESVPKNFPAVSTSAASAGKTTGPLHFNALMQQKLDAELAQYGQTSVHTPTTVYLVKPLAPMFTPLAGSADTSSATIWLANQAKPAPHKPTTAAASSPAATLTTSSSTTSTTQPQAQVLVPSTSRTANGSLLKDLTNLFTIKSGKLVNFTTANLDNLKQDFNVNLNLGLNPPKNVAPHPATAHPLVTAAETLVGVPTAGGNGSVQPTPIP
jgi:hypothetical protein